MDARGSHDHRNDLLHKAYSVETVRGMERPLLERGVPLMRMAASATAKTTAQLLEANGIAVSQANVVLLAGAGDNGGDGLYAAAGLAGRGATVTTIAVGKSLHLAGLLAFTHAGGKLLVLDPQSRIPGAANGFGPGEAGERLEAATAIAREADVVIDAMTGIGVKGALRGLAATLAEMMADSVRQSGHSPLVVAVDTPSGVGVDDGTLPGAYIPADITMMFGAMKPCAMLPPAAYACGKVTLVDFGFDTAGALPAVRAASDATASDSIRMPQPTDGKYSRGVVGLITGSAHYPGAAVLSSKAAAHANVGMVRYVGPASVSGAVVNALPESVAGKGRVQSWVVGSGVADDAHTDDATDNQRATIKALLNHYDLDGNAEEAKAMPAICVDAGALDLLPDHVPAQVVLTPHSHELARFLNLRGASATAMDVEAEPWHWARRTHELTGATVLLKGAITIIVGEDNDIDASSSQPITMVSGSGPAWLATAGSGDVLAGIMGGLLAQQGDDILQEHHGLMVNTAATAAYVHGLAAQIASDTNSCGWEPPVIFETDEPHGLHRPGRPITASDVIRAIPEAIGRLIA